MLLPSITFPRLAKSSGNYIGDQSVKSKDIVAEKDWMSIIKAL